MKRPGSRFCLVAVISLLLGAIWHASASAAVAPTLVSLGQIRDLTVLATPGRIDVDAAGAVYVTDARKGAVVKFDKYGQWVRSYTGASVSGAGVAVSPDGSRIYVAGTSEVSILDGNSGALLGTLTGFATVGEVDLDADGRIFVADAGAMVVKVFNAQGGAEYQFGGLGVAPGQFRTIWAMSVNENAGEVYVADVQTYSTSYPKVQVFDLAGNLKRSLLASNGFGSPAITFFGGCTFDQSGRAYFPDTFRNQLRILSLPTTYLAAFGVSGYGVGQLQGPIDSIFDPLTSRIFVTTTAAG
jgi:DNA-binding beta-propeller fold protein YncE